MHTGKKTQDKVVYLTQAGGVVGVNIDWLNSKIDYFNSRPFLRENGTFWEWLSLEEGEEFRGISFWSAGCRIHTIKSGRGCV